MAFKWQGGLQLPAGGRLWVVPAFVAEDVESGSPHPRIGVIPNRLPFEAFGRREVIPKANRPRRYTIGSQ